MKLRTFVCLFFFALSTAVFAQRPDSLRVLSPDGQLALTLSLRDLDGDLAVPCYEVLYKGRAVVLPSRLGLKKVPHSHRNSDWYRGFKITGVERRSQNSTWKPLLGEQETYPDHFNELTATFQLTDTLRKGIVQIVARAYNEGVAFRYFFPEHSHTQVLELADEQTYFALPAGTQAWHTHAAQETYHKVPLRDWKRNAELPVTLELPDGLYASIAQAEQVNYPRIQLATTAQENVLRSQLFGEVVETSPYATPWRVLLVAERPGQLLENNYLIQNLNPPTALADPSWIKPGTVMREVTLSTEGARRLVDFAVEQQIDYLHFDAGWYGYEYDHLSDATTVTVDPRRNPKGDLDLPEAIRYAASKGKKVILYVNHRALEKQLDTLLPLFKSWGVAGIKYGFVHTGSHRWTTWLHEAVQKAAKYQLVLDIHDDYRPTGFSRTYPNLLTQEGILGNEGFPDATHNTILPFTRYLAGAADYTFCFNTHVIRPDKSKTTQAHQLALPVLYFSPLQYLFWYGKPEHFPNTEEFELWKGIPTVWDETRVLDGTPGEFVSIARRKGTLWYLGGITNTEARTLKLDLNFLEKGKKYQATVYEDDGSGNVKTRVEKVKAGTSLKASLLASGGVAMLIRESE